MADARCTDIDRRRLERGDVRRNWGLWRRQVFRRRCLYLLRRVIHLRQLYPSFYKTVSLQKPWQPNFENFIFIFIFAKMVARKHNRQYWKLRIKIIINYTQTKQKYM